MSTSGYSEDELYLLTLRNSLTPIGLLAGRVLDKVEEAFKLEHDRIYSDYICGTSLYEDKTIIFLDSAAIASEIEKSNQGKTRQEIQSGTVEHNS